MNDLLDEIVIPDLLADIGEIRRNGHVGAFTHVCDSCGQEFKSNRRQLPGKHAWCRRPECRRVAGAVRAKDYRDRKAKEVAL